MLNKIKKLVIPMLESVEQALDFLFESPANVNTPVADDTIGVITAINSVLGEESAAITDHGNRMIKLIKLLKKHNFAERRQSLSKTFEIYKNVINELPIKYKALFLPYYDNTWDSLKSVYEAFSRDPQFETEIVIIPIMRNTPTGETKVYKDYLTPQNIPNTNYNVYDFETDQPDIVFYNNPYDGVNIPKFQSHNIKPYAGLMVYVPYHLRGEGYHSEEIIKVTIETYIDELPGHNNSDVFVVQGKWFSEKYHESKNVSKMVPLGNPKTDNMFTYMNSGEWKRYSEWEEKLESKCVFLLNTHYSLTSPGPTPLHRIWFSHMLQLVDHIFNFIESNEKAALIWRPHPQTFFMLQNRDDKLAELFRSFFRRVIDSGRMILDRTESVVSALMYSNAMISQYSSTIIEMMFLNKPIFLFNYDSLKFANDENEYYKSSYLDVLKKANEENAKGNYYFNAVEHCGLDDVIPEGETVFQSHYLNPCMSFMNEIIAGIDTKKEDRERYCKHIFTNTDGTCGEKILEYIKNKFC